MRGEGRGGKRREAEEERGWRKENSASTTATRCSGLIHDGGSSAGRIAPRARLRGTVQLVLLERKEQRLSPIEDRGIAALPVTGELTSSLATRQGQKSTSITHLTAPKDMERSRPPCPIISELTGHLIEQQKLTKNI